MIRRLPSALAALLCIAICDTHARAQVAHEQGASEEGRVFTRVIAPEKTILRPRLRFQRLGREQGLPQNSVASIVQDRAGFMWIATADGLARYDGQRFIVYRNEPNDPKSLSASYVNRLLVAKDGTLWIGTEGGGVNRFNPATSTFDRFIASDDPESLHSGSISALAEGPDGRLWIGTLGGGLAVLDPATGKVRSFSVEDGLSENVSAVLVEPDGALWIGTDSGLYRREAKGTSFALQFQDDAALKDVVVTALMRDRDGDLWVATDGKGLVHYAPKTRRVEAYRADAERFDRLADDSITTVFQDRSGRIWIGTQQLLHTLDPARGTIERHPPDLGDPMTLAGGVVSVFEDTDGVIWVGTLGGGAAVLDPRSWAFHFYKTKGGSALYQRGPDLWIGTSEGICRLRGKQDLEGDCWPIGPVTTAIVDRHGDLWVGTIGSGLLRLPAQTRDHWTIYQNLPNDPESINPGPVLSILDDATGNIWVGLLGGGLQRLDVRRNQFANFSLPTSVVYAIKGDPRDSDVLWLGTDSVGLIRMKVSSAELRAYTPKPKDIQTRTDNAAVDFAFDGDSAIWIATFGGGLKRLELASGTFKTWGRAEGMPSDTLYALLIDKTGLLWISSIAGLARFDPKSGRIEIFTTADGLQSDEFTQAQRFAGDDGRFYFAGINGFNVFQPEQIAVDRAHPPLLLTSVRVDDRPYGVGRPLSSLKEMELDYDQSFAAIEFAALSYSGSDRYRFDYKVEGLNNAWIRSDNAAVTLTGLGGAFGGDYTLVVRARNRHGVESPLLRLGIRVAPPPWFTWWAFVAYGLVLLGIGFVIYRYQQARIERLQKLARLATVEKEFEITAAVQSWFLPEAQRFTNGIVDLVGFYRGAEKCSGDWWWYEDIGRGRLWIIVADVTGHGAGPAMLTAAVAMGLSVQGNIGHEDPVTRLSRLNTEVLQRCKGKSTMTMTAVVLDQNSGEVVLYGLGGLPALLVGRSGNHEAVGASGTPLGSVANLSVGQRTVTMAPGDRLLITTDGIVEAPLSNGRPLGFRRFVNVIREVRNVPLDVAVDKIVRDIDMARGNQPQEDDFTFCMVERRG